MLTDDRLARWVAAHPVKWRFVVALEAVFIIGPFSRVYSLVTAGVAVGGAVVGVAN